jgi:hypothetical protein
VESATSKERLRTMVDGLTEEDARLALRLVQHLLEAAEENEWDAAEIVVPPAGSFTKLQPLVVSGPLSSELLIADRR